MNSSVNFDTTIYQKGGRKMEEIKNVEEKTNEQKIQKVTNPLTIIALFAGFAEVAGTVILPLLDKELQTTFIWFIIGFPIILVVCFFITLNFNTEVLYSPSDYKNEEHFLKAIITPINFSKKLDKLLEELKTAKEKIAELENSKNLDICSTNRDNDVDVDDFEKVIKELKEEAINISLTNPKVKNKLLQQIVD